MTKKTFREKLTQHWPRIRRGLAVAWKAIQFSSVILVVTAMILRDHLLADFSGQFGCVLAILVVGISATRVARRIETIDRRVSRQELPMVERMTNDRAYEALMNTLRTRCSDVRRVRSTAIQQDFSVLTPAIAYFSELYEIFRKHANRVALENLIRLPTKASDDDLDKLVRVCFEPLVKGESRSDYADSRVQYALTTAMPNYPFINFTLINYADGTQQVFFGWYVVSTAHQLKDFASHEVFGQTTSSCICQLFEGVFTLAKLECTSAETGKLIEVLPTTDLIALRSDLRRICPCLGVPQ